MSVSKNKELLPFAKQLRKEMTTHERKLWYLFLRRYPVKIYKQRIVGPYIADFYCASAMLVIEVDGSQHYSDEERKHDQARTADLKTYGLEVLRFSNRDIDREFDGVCMCIDHVI